MDLGSFSLGSDAKVDVCLSKGQAIITITVTAQAEADVLLAKLKAQLPAMLQPVVDVIQKGVDAELSK